MTYPGRRPVCEVIAAQDVARTAYWLGCEARKSTGQLIDMDAGFLLG